MTLEVIGVLVKVVALYLMEVVGYGMRTQVPHARW